MTNTDANDNDEPFSNPYDLSEEETVWLRDLIEHNVDTNYYETTPTPIG